VPAEALREGREEIKKPEPVKQEPVKLEPLEEKIIKETKVFPLPEEPACPSKLDSLEEELSRTIYLGAKDMEGYQLVSTIQYEILKNWKPPMGLPHGIECKVNIKVDKDGKVENFKIEKSSNIFAYDMSLRNAILQSIMPNEVRCREFVLTLNC
jgi:outer membrane biosynthesis protein TonB